MIVQAIAEQENIQADKEDVDKEIDFMAMQYQLDADKIKEMLGPDNIAFIEKDIKIRKAIDDILKKRLLNKELLVNIFKKDIVLTDWACPIG